METNSHQEAAVKGLCYLVENEHERDVLSCLSTYAADRTPKRMVSENSNSKVAVGQEAIADEFGDDGAEIEDHGEDESDEEDGSDGGGSLENVSGFDNECDVAMLKIELLANYREGACPAELVRLYPAIPRSQVYRILNGKGRFDGSSKPGRAPALSDFSEVAIASVVRSLLSSNISVSMPELSKMAQKVWLAEGHSGEPPSFAKNWRKGFSKRHPHLKLKLMRVQPKDKERATSSTSPRVRKCLNGYKHVLNHKDAGSVFVMDELNVAANDKGIGAKRVAVGASKPSHTAPNDTPHVTAAPFISLSGDVACVAYIVPNGTKGTEPFKELPNAVILHSSSGSVTSTDGVDGTVMSTVDKIYFRFVKALREARHPEWPELVQSDFWKEPSSSEFHLDIVLIVDGFRAHSEHAALRFLAANGVRLLQLPANMTHLVQIGDMPSINGHIQGSLRKLKATLGSSGERPSVGAWITFAHETIMRQVTYMSVRQACATIGISYEDYSTLSVTNDSIDRAIAMMIRDGKINKEDPVDQEDCMILRSPAYLEKITPSAVARKTRMTERIANTLSEIEQTYRVERGILPDSANQRTCRRRGRKRLPASSGLKDMNNPTALEKRSAETERKKAIVAALEQRREQAKLTRIRKDGKLAEAEGRWKALQALFPNQPIDQFRNNVKLYVGGSSKMPRERAKEHLTKLLSGGAPSSGVHSSSRKRLKVSNNICGLEE